MGTMYHNKELYKEAIEYYKQAVKLDPDYIYAHENMGNTYEQLGKMRSSRKAYHQAEILKAKAK